MVYCLFFLSGFTALLYEVVWQRLLHLTFGLSTYAVTTVTASFMLGLALGYLLGQSRRLTQYHPLVVYGVAEGAIGAFALLFPFLMQGIDAVYVAAGGSFIFNVLLSLLVLAFPATLMGLTLPTLARYVAQDGPMGRRIGLLYALNTTGAVFGAFFAGVFFIRTYGVFSTTMIATAINAVGGVTLGAVTKHDVQVEAVDIVPDVRDAMALFAKENDNVLQRTNWRLIADDGRHYLKISPRRYDVITADATHPAAAESWVLYTQEYYELVKAKLTEKGVFAQWLPLHNMAPTDYLAVLRTFHSVFPAALLLFTNRYTLLIGAKAQLPLTPAALDQRLFSLNDTVRSDLKEVGVNTGQDVLKFIIFDGAGIDKLAGEDYPILTDNHTSVEFAELNRLGMAGTMPFILARLLPAIRPDALAEQYGLAPQVALARVLFMRSKAVRTDDPLERSYQALREVDQASRLAPDDGDIGYYKQLTLLEFLDLRNARYTELLNSASPQTLLPKAAFAVQLQPKNHFVQELLGVTLLKLQRYEDAVTPLEAAASLKQDDVTYLSNLAFVYDQVGRSTDALHVLRQAKMVKPEAGKFLDEAIKRIEQKVDGGS